MAKQQADVFLKYNSQSNMSVVDTPDKKARNTENISHKTQNEVKTQTKH